MIHVVFTDTSVSITQFYKRRTAPHLNQVLHAFSYIRTAFYFQSTVLFI